MATATDQVFKTVELLEHILLQLPPKDVLLSQRVNKQWKDTITTSKKLQRLLFFVCIPSSPVGKTADSVFFMNPLLSSLFTVRKHLRCRASWSTKYMDKLPPAWKLQEASWRQMHVVQPRAALDQYLRWSNKRGHYFQVSEGHGRAGQIYSKMEEAGISRPRGWVRSRMLVFETEPSAFELLEEYAQLEGATE